MNWDRARDGLKDRVSGMSIAEQFRFYALWYAGLEYKGGQENFVYGADCSGVVCGPLWLMGYDIRCTANDLYREIFTDEVQDYESRSEIIAAFYLTGEERTHFGAQVGPGYVTHVTPMVGRYVVLNAFDPIQPMSAAYVRKWYEARGFTVEWRQLNNDALIEHHRKRDLMFGVDPILQELRPWE